MVIKCVKKAANIGIKSLLMSNNRRIRDSCHLASTAVVLCKSKPMKPSLIHKTFFIENWMKSKFQSQDIKKRLWSITQRTQSRARKKSNLKMKGSIKMQQAAILNSNLIWLSRKKMEETFWFVWRTDVLNFAGKDKWWVWVSARSGRKCESACARKGDRVREKERFQSLREQTFGRLIIKSPFFFLTGNLWCRCLGDFLPDVTFP